MYIVLGTRGDIAYAVSVASRYLTNPEPQHMKLVRRILRYLKGTKSIRLTYKGHLEMPKGFTDAGWAGCHDTRRSTAGYMFNIGSGAISWQSKRQSVVALSTCEAEFMGQTQATKEAVWSRWLLSELDLSKGKAQLSFAATTKAPSHCLHTCLITRAQSTWASNTSGEGRFKRLGVSK